MINPKDFDQENNSFAKTYKTYVEILHTLPKERGWMTEYLVQYQDIWLASEFSLKGLMLIQDHFKSQPTDIFLGSFPKTGTTWLKAIIFTVMNRARYDISTHPLLTNGPHDCLPFLDTLVYQSDSMSYIDGMPSPRLFSTHIPFTLLPKSMTMYSSCKFVYITRDPKDVLVSIWVFMNKLRSKELRPLSLEEAFELFSEGVTEYGSFWDHTLGYWRASLEFPERILLLKYEEMKGRNASVHVKKLAEFLGKPFSKEEESEGVVDEIVKLCDFKNLSNLEVNKASDGLRFSKEINVTNCDFFRKGEVGDWRNHLTVEMMTLLDEITGRKLSTFGLSYDDFAS